MWKISRKKWFRVLAVLLILGGVAVCLHWPAPVKIIISHETTRITGPVNPDGTINYVAAFNAMASEGVTPENNAAIPLIQAFGPDMFPDEIREEVLRTLNLSSLPAKGDYFAGLEDYVKANSLAEEQADENFEKAIEQPWSAKEYPIIAGWLKANEKPLAVITAATKRPRYYVPLVSRYQLPQMMTVLLPTLGQSRAVAKALSARAMLKLDSGDIEGVWADIMVTHRLAGLISQDSTLVGRLASVAIESLACQATETVATCGNLTAKQAKAFLTDLESLPPLPDITEAIDRGDRFAMLDCVMMMWRGGDFESIGATNIRHSRWSRSRLDWNEILRTFNYWYDRQVEANRKETFAERKEALVVVKSDMAHLIPQMGVWTIARTILKALAGRPMRKSFSRDMANLLASISMPSNGRVSEAHDRTVMRLHLTRIAMALAAHKAKSGNYPDKLETLVPVYLEVIPDDLFVDKPLKYSREGNGYLLYSLGPNMKDDGGSDNRDDIPVRAADDVSRQTQAK